MKTAYQIDFRIPPSGDGLLPTHCELSCRAEPLVDEAKQGPPSFAPHPNVYLALFLQDTAQFATISARQQALKE